MKRPEIPNGLRLTTGTPAELVADIRDLLNAYPGGEVVIQKRRSRKWPYVLTARKPDPAIEIARHVSRLTRGARDADRLNGGYRTKREAAEACELHKRFNPESRFQLVVKKQESRKFPFLAAYT